MAVAFTRSDQPGTEEATLFYGNERDADTFSIKEDGIRPTEDRNRALFAWETRSLVRKRILQLVIGLLGIAIIVSIILAFKLSGSDTEYAYLGTARFKLKEKRIDFKNAAGIFSLSARVGLKLSSHLMERHAKSTSTTKYVTSDGVSLVLVQETKSSFAVNWTSSSKQPMIFKDCFYLSKAHWYGGSELLSQKWPMEKVKINMGQYVPHGDLNYQNESTQMFGSVLERYWLSSRGIAIIVDASVPLHVSINAGGDGQLCLKSDTSGYLQPVVSYLGYRILSGYNPRDLHLMVIEQFIGKPNTIPNLELIVKPSWIIANYTDSISKKDVESLKDKISWYKYNCGYVVISSQYVEKKENYNFDHMNQLKSNCCNVSMKIHPYLKVSSKNFSEAVNNDYLLKDCGGKVPGLIKWGKSLAACIDVTRNSSIAWFKRLLRIKQHLGFDSFEFHGGEVTHLPACYKFYNQTMDPGHFSSEYAKFAASVNGLNVHVGYRTQNLPVFVKMNSKDSTWNDVTGLKTLIPTVLTYGIMGYPYVLPSVVGGHHGEAEKELYIRWMQVNVFLPGVQFDKAPWEIDNETVTIVRDLLKLRSQLSPVIIDAFKNVTKTGAPIVRPLWWVAPTDPEAQKINSQFMLGDTFLVAPVLERNITSHLVYIPVGHWQEQFDKKQIINNRRRGQWKRYNVTPRTIPYFKCLALYD